MFSLTYSYGAAPSLSPPAHVSGWVQSGSRSHSRDRVPQARSLRVQPGQCRSPEGRGWQMSRADDRTGCRPSAAGTGSTYRNARGEGRNAADFKSEDSRRSCCTGQSHRLCSFAGCMAQVTVMFMGLPAGSSLWCEWNISINTEWIAMMCS